MNTLIDDRLKKLRFDHTDTIDGFNTLCEEDIAQIKSELLKAIMAQAKDFDVVTHDFGTPQVIATEKAVPVEAIKQLFGEEKSNG